ncbi:MAG: hypothetical protein CM1200mP26_05410 [Acidimicrobiales bacterium]|nr:MAG: hypothetical protein CM1200mP26_05410 [Acidimicrobiales bacterium]
MAAIRCDLTRPLCGVISALEMACWDIIGKATGSPVYDLLGGRVHEGLRSYTYLYPENGDAYGPVAGEPDGPDLYTDPDLAAEVALRAVEMGFTAVKFDPAGPYTVFDGRHPALLNVSTCRSAIPGPSGRPSATGLIFYSAPTASSPLRGPYA